MRHSGKRKISTGTITVLAAALLILAGTLIVLARLSSGKPVDLTKLQAAVLNLKGEDPPQEVIPPASETKQTEVRTAVPAAAATAAPAPAQSEKSFTLTAGGTAALDGEVRKNSWYQDAKQYDYYDTMMLLKKELQSDLNIIFLENLLTVDGKTTDLTASNAGAAMLKAAGFDMAACGFSKAYDKAEDGLAETYKVLGEHGIQPVGILENPDQDRVRIQDVNGIRTAVLQYTGTIPAATRKNMTKKGTSNLVPEADADLIAADIAEARSGGSEAVIVLLNWGKVGKAPDKNMRTLAEKIAAAGADLIIGNGSRIVSGAEFLTVPETGRQVLCVWSLGTALSGERSNIKRIAGILLQATVRVVNGQTEVSGFSYIPLYTWKYKQDTRFYYRCLAADRAAPDGMDADQQKMMKKAVDTVQAAMKGSPVEERLFE